MEGNIGPCKSVSLNVRFQMQNALQEFVKFKKAVQEAYDHENPYDSNVSKFEGVMPKYEEKVQEMKIFTMESNGKRIK